MLFTAVISIFVSELLSDTARPEFITQSPCIMHGNPLLTCHSASVQCPGHPAAACSFLQLPRSLSIHCNSCQQVDHNSLAKHVGQLKCLFVGSS